MSQSSENLLNDELDNEIDDESSDLENEIKPTIQNFSKIDNDQKVSKPKQVAKLFRDHEIKLLKPLLEFLRGNSNCRLIGPGDNVLRAPTVAFVPKNKKPSEVARDLSKYNIMSGAGDFYAVRPLKALGINPDEGVVRLSFVHYTSENEVKILIEALEKIL